MSAHKHLSEESGYSLIEVIASIIIMGIAILPMLAMFDTGLNSASRGSNYDKARMLANANVENVQSLSYLSARTTYKPLNADPPGGPVSCDQSILPAEDQDMFSPPRGDCEVITNYVDDDYDPDNYDPDSNANIQMQVVVTVQWDDISYTTTGLKAR
jgi:prepilin-type N-terminal cleavage/methylation domain-containing protein